MGEEMKHILFALLAVCLGLTAAHAADDNILNKLVNIPSPKSWMVQGQGQEPKFFEDKTVQSGQAMRFVVPQKGDHPWSVSANVGITKPVKAGDVILLAFWARAEVPAEGQQTGILSGIRIQQTKAPYAAFAQDKTNVTSKWTMYYASGVADKDYKPGSLEVTIWLGAAKQTIDFGPVFVLDFGPDYDKAKLPHNKPVPAAAPASAPAAATATPAPVTNASAEQHFAGELAKIRAMLPVPGALINDPAVSKIGSYGPDQTKEIIAAPELPGKQAVRVHVEKAQSQYYAVGTSSPLTGAIRKGDTIFVAFYARTGDNNSGSGVISSMQVELQKAPYTPAVESAVTVPKGGWQLFYFWGVAQADIPAGTGMLSAQIGAYKQVLEFGPAFVLNLGPDVPSSALPQKITD